MAKIRRDAMIEITDLTGHNLFLVPDSIIQIYYADYRTSASGSVVLYDGSMQATRERAEDLVARIKDRVPLIDLHIVSSGSSAPSFPIWLSASHIVGLKATPNGTIVMAGLKASELVIEDYSAVVKKMNATKALVASLTGKAGSRSPALPSRSRSRNVR
jgi:uncharacterized protein YlzI (FlbEa/FlbD family)